MTNEKWLKSQDKETVAEMLIYPCKCCYHYNHDNACSASPGDSCADGIIKWLSMEHSEGDE